MAIFYFLLLNILYITYYVSNPYHNFTDAVCICRSPQLTLTRESSGPLLAAEGSF